MENEMTAMLAIKATTRLSIDFSLLLLYSYIKRHLQAHFTKQKQDDLHYSNKDRYTEDMIETVFFNLLFSPFTTGFITSHGPFGTCFFKLKKMSFILYMSAVMS